MSGRVLLTGGSGFIGRALLRRLLAERHEVLALYSKQKPALRDSKVEWRRLDLLGCSADELRLALLDEGLDSCLHAAWYTKHADYLVHPVNGDWVAASLRLADAFKAAHGRRFVALGTCIEYDTFAAGRCTEGETPLRPDTLYGECKAALYRAFDALGGNYAWARIFFVYGPGDRAERLVPQVLSTLARGETAEPRTGGLRRDYIHVDDLAGQLIRILDGTVRGAVNTGTGHAVSISDIFETAADLFGRPDLVRRNAELGRGQPHLIEADLTRFRREVGGPSTRSLREGLAPLVEAAQ